MVYAAGTTVSAEQSLIEIERTVVRYGAGKFATYRDEARAVVEFCAHERRVRFVLPFPDRNSNEFTMTKSRREKRSENARLKAWEQACRARWRALLMAIKSKLESVEAGIALFEDEFLANVVDPVTNQTVGSILKEPLKLRYSKNPPSGMLSLPAPQ